MVLRDNDLASLLRHHVAHDMTRLIPWFEPHHAKLFDALPPPEHDADLILDKEETQRAAGWSRARWTELNGGGVAWREHLGNLKHFKGSGSFSKEEWRAEQIAMQRRNRFTNTSGTARNRKRDNDGNLVLDEPVYYRTIKFRVRFSDPRRQHEILSNWMGAARYTYNRALRGVREGMPLRASELRDRYVVEKSVAGTGRQPVTEEGVEAKRKRLEKKEEARKKQGYETGELLREKEWLKNTPSSIRSAAVNTLLQANTALCQKATLARQNGDAKRSNQSWNLHLKERDDPSASTICVEHTKLRDFKVVDRPTRQHNHVKKERRKWTRFNLFDSDARKAARIWRDEDGRTLGELYLTEDLSKPKFGGDGKTPISIDHDCKLTRDARGRFFLHVPIVTPLPAPKPLADRQMGAVDPGARTPFTAWGPTGHGSYGEDAFKERILPLCKKLDVLIGRRDRVVAIWKKGEWEEMPWLRWKGREVVEMDFSKSKLKTYERILLRLEYRIAVVRDRIKHMVNELHRRAARSLLDKFDTVLLPVFETHEMVRHVDETTGRRRFITSAAARSMMTWSHYRFRAFLKHKALMRGKEVVVVDEAYTTKGCSRCGRVTEIGGSKTFRCQHCGLCAPRDAKSARDIFVKHIVAGATTLLG